jgi:ribosomal protein S9
MRRIAIAIVLALLSIECHAQNGPSTGQCDQIRTAIAQYGLQAARKHAMANYGLSQADLRTIEQGCGIGDRGRRDKRSR